MFLSDYVVRTPVGHCDPWAADKGLILDVEGYLIRLSISSIKYCHRALVFSSEVCVYGNLYVGSLLDALKRPDRQLVDLSRAASCRHSH